MQMFGVINLLIGYHKLNTYQRILIVKVLQLLRDKLMLFSATGIIHFLFFPPQIQLLANQAMPLV